MSATFEFIFNLLINLSEAFLIYLLLSRKLQLKSSYLLTLVCFLLQALAVTGMNQLIPVVSVRLAITVVLDILITLILSIDSLTKSIFWACVYPIITVFADTLTVVLGSLFIQGSLSSLTEYPTSITMTFLYLLICFFCVILLIKQTSSKFSIPWLIQFAWIFIVLAGIIAIEFLLDLLIQLKESSPYIINRLFLLVIILLVILFFSILFFYYMGILYHKNIELLEENKQKQFEKQQFELLSNTNQLLRTWKHDFQNHLSVLKIMVKKQDFTSVQNYLNSINKEMNQNTWQIQTGNNVLDAVLTSKLSKIQSYDINFTHSVFLPDGLPLNNLELTSLMGNLLDNAIESCANLDSSHKRSICLDIKPYNQFLYINLSNSSAGKHRYNFFNELISTKQEEGHGIGLRRIQHIVTEANGFMKIDPKDDSFHVTIVLPLPNQIITKGNHYES